MIHVFVVWALSFSKLNCSSLIIKLKLKVLLFKTKVVIEKRFSVKILNFLILNFFFSRGLFSSPNSKSYLFPPPPGGENGQNIHPCIRGHSNNMWHCKSEPKKCIVLFEWPLRQMKVKGRHWKIANLTNIFCQNANDAGIMPTIF